MRLGSTAQTPEIGHLILKHLCPAIHAVLLDGLKPHVRSLFGRMRNSVWKVVEDSAELGKLELDIFIWYFISGTLMILIIQ